MRILGVDPGIMKVGYGCIDVLPKDKFVCVKSGLFVAKRGTPLEKQLRSISQQLRNLIRTYKPARVGIEKLFFNKNVTSALTVAHARGVMLETLAQFNSVTIVEVTPTAVKSALTGNGRASKQEVRKMVQLLTQTNLNGAPDDVSDALAVAIAVRGRRVD